jgi:hypothetical protein
VYLCIRFQKRCGDERKIANRLHTPEHHADVEGLRRLPHRSRGRWRITIPEPSIVRHNRLAEKRIYRDCQIGEFVGSDDMTLSSRPIASISASLHSYQSRSKFAAWFHGTWHRNKIRQRSYFEVASHTWCRSWLLSPLNQQRTKAAGPTKLTSLALPMMFNNASWKAP